MKELLNTTIDAGVTAASSTAGQADGVRIFAVTFGVLGALLAIGLTLFFAHRHARRSATERPAAPRYATWIGVVIALVAMLFVTAVYAIGARVYLQHATSPADAMEVLVTGKQWLWKVQHPTGRREINELHVPVGQPVRLTMTADDVVHTLCIPAFRLNVAALPGRFTQATFTPTVPGAYFLTSSAYDGANHSLMGGGVYVLTQDEYEQWLKSDAAAGASAQMTPEEAGKALFVAKTCITCHSGLPGAIGPNMKGVFGRKEKLADGSTITVDEPYIRESVRTPLAKVVAGFQPVMPVWTKELVTDDQLEKIIAYLKSYK